MMKFKQFHKWCEERTCDGCWCARDATVCVYVCGYVLSHSWWKRKKLWEKCNKQYNIEEGIIKPINKYLTLLEKGEKQDV